MQQASGSCSFFTGLYLIVFPINMDSQIKFPFIDLYTVVEPQGRHGCRGVDPSSTLGYDLVARQRQLHACVHRGCLRGDVPPQKLENSVFLPLESCNLVNTFRCKFRVGDE